MLLGADAAGSPAITATFLAVTSEEVTYRLLIGDLADPTAPHADGASYLASIGQDDTDLGRALDQVLPWLGEHLARPIAELLHAGRATGTTLVVCGNLVYAPLHATSWVNEAGETTCLADVFDLRYAPSVAVHAQAVQRAATRRPRRFVALADPSGDLPAARAELMGIVSMFPPGETCFAVGDAATTAFLTANAPSASHLHLACHATGGMYDPDAAAVVLADGDVLTGELPSTIRLDARLVVASACESAIGPLNRTPGEELTIASALLSAGAACVIASLWPVDDFATALLMTRCYEGILTDALRPPEALRQAQLWLRVLTEADEDAYLATHPELERARDCRLASAGMPGRRTPTTPTPTPPTGVRPYAHPEYWAAFIAAGT